MLVLLQVLFAHVLPGIVGSEETLAAVEEAAPQPASATTLFGTDIEAVLDDEGNVIVSPANTDIHGKIVSFDNPVCSGIVGIVDAVLVPAGIEDVGMGMYGEAGHYGNY